MSDFFAYREQISAIAGRCEQPGANPTTFAIRLESPERFIASDNPCSRGIIQPQYGQMIQGLLDEKTLILHGSCTTEAGSTPRRPNQSYAQLSCVLEITVYGPFELFEEIGEWFQGYNIYLQDPRICHMDVRYCNPQRLSSGGLLSCPYVSQIISRSSEVLHFQDVVDQPDLLDIISGQEDLQETEAPKAIRAMLHR